MQSITEVVSQLQHAHEMLDPILASLHQQDFSELFLSVAPGVVAEAFRILQQAVCQLIARGWVAGRRGRISQALIDVLGHLQQALHAAEHRAATRHGTAAAERLQHTLQEISRVPARRSRR